MLPAMNILQDKGATLRPNPGWAPLALGFRPFFLLAGAAGVLLIALWPLVWRGQISVAAHYGGVAWHAHEMLFGYTAAVVAGFLLTAVRNWTGIQTWTGRRLLGLALVWAAARLLPWIAGVPSWLLVAVDVAFLPLVAFSLVKPLWQGQNRVNRIFLPLLGAMALANLLSHLQMLGVVEHIGDMRRVMLELVLLLIAVVAGRVMPFFTQNVLPGFKAVQRAWVERTTFVLLVLIALVQCLPDPARAPLGALWLVFGLVQLVRMAGWFEARLFKLPVLWVLHIGYAWLTLGALLTGLAAFDLFPAPSALHALTVGGVGVFTFGMMARVIRGHTGRPIDVNRGIAWAFIVMNLAALERVFGTAWFGGHYARWVDVAGLLWVVAFVAFVWFYAPMLLRARPDGRPG